MVSIFQSFLRESIGQEVLVVNTNIGMEVYYYSKNDYSKFIKESVLLYTLSQIDQKKLRFKNHLSKEEVYRSFCEALFTFSKYPQIFLAYSKKFIHLKRNNESSKYVIPILNSFFVEMLEVLNKTGKMPHFDKIDKAQKQNQIPDRDQKVIKDLVSEILMKKHYN